MLFGQERTTPLIYGRSGDDYLILPRRDDAPARHLNLQAGPRVEIEVMADASRSPHATRTRRRRPTGRSPWSC